MQEDWASAWQTSDRGEPLANLFNAMVTLRNHPAMKSILRYDQMAMAATLWGQIPGAPADPNTPRHVTDADVLAIQEAMQRVGMKRVARATVDDAVSLRAVETSYHPVRDYLNALVWDGQPRVDNWLCYYLGTEPKETASEATQHRQLRYFRKIGRLFLIAMVARVMKPGCKADYMMILEGPQGALKSSACAVLAGDYFSSNLPDLSRGDMVRVQMHLRGKWLIEIGELASFSAAEAETLKAFVTQTEEQYVAKYAHREVREPRQCLFIGSTNQSAYLRDPTGGRRFWPVPVGIIDLESLRQDRDQLFAEAVHLYQAGEKWWPDRQFEAEFIAPEQSARYEADVWHDTIETWLRVNNILQCTVSEVLTEALHMSVNQTSTREQRRVAGILTQMGWTLHRTMNKRNYVKPSHTEFSV